MATIVSIIEFLRAIISLGERLAKVAKDQSVASWINDLEGSIDQLEKAGTLNEKVEAAKRLSALARRMG